MVFVFSLLSFRIEISICHQINVFEVVAFFVLHVTPLKIYLKVGVKKLAKNSMERNPPHASP